MWRHGLRATGSGMSNRFAGNFPAALNVSRHLILWRIRLERARTYQPLGPYPKKIALSAKPRNFPSGLSYHRLNVHYLRRQHFQPCLGKKWFCSFLRLLRAIFCSQVAIRSTSSFDTPSSILHRPSVVFFGTATVATVATTLDTHTRPVPPSLEKTIFADSAKTHTTSAGCWYPHHLPSGLESLGFFDLSCSRKPLLANHGCCKFEFLPFVELTRWLEALSSLFAGSGAINARIP
jgi:hypothetical protein